LAARTILAANAVAVEAVELLLQRLLSPFPFPLSYRIVLLLLTD
jgi:hypothetical protein